MQDGPMMSTTVRGADIVVEALQRHGCKRIFTLSGNHIMSIFDAVLGTDIALVHVRHEAAAVHMADAWGRLTGEPGVAMVTGGPGHANAIGALFAARAAESPMVLLSGHAATWELGRGGFQEIKQAEMAAPVTKASWTSSSIRTLPQDIHEAMHIAAAGRPGPVHVSLPSDILDEEVDADGLIWPDRRASRTGRDLAPAIADAVVAAIASASRPIIFAPPQLSSAGGRALLVKLRRRPTRLPWFWRALGAPPTRAWAPFPIWSGRWTWLFSWARHWISRPAGLRRRTSRRTFA